MHQKGTMFASTAELHLFGSAWSFGYTISYCNFTTYFMAFNFPSIVKYI